MHYPTYDGIDSSKYTMVALKQEYQNTMRYPVELSFKDIKLLNRLYCTSEYPHKSTLSKSINLKCDVNEYELDYGEYERCKVVELTAKIEKQNINSHAFRVINLIANQILCFFVIKPKETYADRIKAKRTLIEVRKMNGFDCKTYCESNYIEIKYLKDKTATGARICCDKILRISSEEYTEVLIMKKGNIGEYDISYRADLAPSQESAHCVQVDKSIYNGMNLQTPHELVVTNEKGERIFGPPNTGPRFCLTCNRNHTMNINGVYSRNDCVEKNNPDPKCLHHTCFYCKD
uniref:Peptidase M12A domain-containing protein n=1 Tax=Meloidogyne javanica TaxID=6303 RepID=A0A915N503_MELJA